MIMLWRGWTLFSKAAVADVFLDVSGTVWCIFTDAGASSEKAEQQIS